MAWSTQTPPGLLDLRQRRFLMYLGSANNQSVCYDVTTGENLRIPAAQVIVAIQEAGSVPPDC